MPVMVLPLLECGVMSQLYALVSHRNASHSTTPFKTVVYNMMLSAKRRHDAGIEHYSNRAFPDARCYLGSNIIIIIN